MGPVHGWVVALAGCGDEVSVSQQEGSTSEELGAHGGEVCPEELPRTSEDHGLGASEPAESSPALAPPDAAWVCRFNPVDVDPGPNGGGPMFSWVRDGEARTVESSVLEQIARHVDDLEPADERSGCNDDVGSRWILVHAYENDLTGVVSEDFGCRDVLLTDEPFRTPPGDAAQPGTVSGVLTAPDDFLDALKAIE